MRNFFFFRWRSGWLFYKAMDIDDFSLNSARKEITIIKKTNTATAQNDEDDKNPEQF